MKIRNLRSIIAGVLMILAVSPVFAAKFTANVTVGYSSPSGCVLGTKGRLADTGTQEFRDLLHKTLGQVDILKDSCPDVHLFIRPFKKRIIKK